MEKSGFKMKGSSLYGKINMNRGGNENRPDGRAKSSTYQKLKKPGPPGVDDVIEGAKQAYNTVKKSKLADVAKGFKGAANTVKESAKSGFSDIGEGFRQLVTGDRVDKRKKK